MFFIITAAGSLKYPSGLTSGKPPFSFRGPSGTAGFLNVYFIAKLCCLKKKKSDPIQCSKASKKGKKSCPLDFHKMSSLKFPTEIQYFSLCELRFGGIWLPTGHLAAPWPPFAGSPKSTKF